MQIRVLAVPLFLLTLLFSLFASSSGLGQFRGGGPGGSPTLYMLSKDPAGLFDKYAKGRDHFLISETYSLRDHLTQFAKDQGIGGEKISREQFLQFGERMKTKLFSPMDGQKPAGTAPGSASGGTDAANDMNQRAEFEFRRRDIDGDSKLSVQEMSDTLRQTASQWDKNGDGAISLEEYKGYFQARYQERGDQGKGNSGTNVIEVVEEDLDRRPVVLRAGKLPKELEGMFQELDNDQDGQINMAEWRKAGRALADFKDIDRNDDGLLIPEEILRHQAQPQLAGKSDTGRGGFGGFGSGGFGGFGGFGKGGFGKGFKKPGN